MQIGPKIDEIWGCALIVLVVCLKIYIFFFRFLNF